MKIVLASSNMHKVQEFEQLLPRFIQLQTMKELGIVDEIPETGKTFHENAAQKALWLADRIQGCILADDSGLEVQALHGAPGIYSARYAGPGASSKANLEKLLYELAETENRRARFVAVLALIFRGQLHFFEGQVQGYLLNHARGQGGFGYDPIFVPCGHSLSFAEMSPEQKHAISHRAKAAAKLNVFLANHTQV